MVCRSPTQIGMPVVFSASSRGQGGSRTRPRRGADGRANPRHERRAPGTAGGARTFGMLSGSEPSRVQPRPTYRAISNSVSRDRDRLPSGQSPYVRRAPSPKDDVPADPRAVELSRHGEAGVRSTTSTRSATRRLRAQVLSARCPHSAASDGPATRLESSTTSCSSTTRSTCSMCPFFNRGSETTMRSGSCCPPAGGEGVRRGDTAPHLRCVDPIQLTHWARDRYPRQAAPVGDVVKKQDERPRGSVLAHDRGASKWQEADSNVIDATD